MAGPRDAFPGAGPRSPGSRSAAAQAERRHAGRTRRVSGRPGVHQHDIGARFPCDPEVYYRDIQAHRSDEPLFGPLTRNLSPCSFWPAAPAEPPTKVHNAVAVLMVGATGDPSAVYPGQQVAHRALTGSRLVTVRGAFQHTVYVGLFAAQHRCIDDTVNRYLIDGRMPSTDSTCPVVRAAGEG